MTFYNVGSPLHVAQHLSVGASLPSRGKLG